MTDAPVLVDSSSPGIVVLTLNRPRRRNALNGALLESLAEAVAAAESDPTKRVLILRGAGPAFCAGLDLKEALDETVSESVAQLVLRALRSLARSRLISIAEVNGPAMAGGAGLMCACDFALAADDVQIGFPEVHRGLVAALVMCFLSRNMAGRHVRSLVLLGQPVEARHAEAIGLVNQAVPRAELSSRVMRLAQEILQGGPVAVERTKFLLDEFSPWDLGADLDAALRHHTEMRGSAEAAEGLRAFVEKRPPAWQTNLGQEGTR
ncbi:MAG: enoyl-CoA hydratase/isomerase family protein [Planctomycetes bacterium]|nr:enoyl-CoA hydratase/isomerase family protein [Planctomycetota bacterium]